MTDNRCYLEFTMTNGDVHQSPVFDGPGFATDWLESGLRWECPDKMGERLIITRREQGAYTLLNPRYVLTIELKYIGGRI